MKITLISHFHIIRDSGEETTQTFHKFIGLTAQEILDKLINVNVRIVAGHINICWMNMSSSTGANPPISTYRFLFKSILSTGYSSQFQSVESIYNPLNSSRLPSKNF